MEDSNNFSSSTLSNQNSKSPSSKVLKYPIFYLWTIDIDMLLVELRDDYNTNIYLETSNFGGSSDKGNVIKISSTYEIKSSYKTLIFCLARSCNIRKYMFFLKIFRASFTLSPNPFVVRLLAEIMDLASPTSA